MSLRAFLARSPLIALVVAGRRRIPPGAFSIPPNVAGGAFMLRRPPPRLVVQLASVIHVERRFRRRNLYFWGKAPLRENPQERGGADFPVEPPGAPNSAWLAFIRRTSSSYEPVRMMRSNWVR